MALHNYSLYKALIEQNELRMGEHLCNVYEKKEQQLAILLPFIKDGLEYNQKCIHILEEHAVEELKSVIRDAGVDVDSAIAKGQLIFVTNDASITKCGTFDPDSLINLLKKHVDNTLEDGYDALRFTIEMKWVLKSLKNKNSFIEYETKLHKLISEKRVLSICQFDEKEFTDDIITTILQIHPLLIYGDRLYRNRYYISPAELLHDLKKKGGLM